MGARRPVRIRRSVLDLTLWGIRTGRWWLPLVAAALLITAVGAGILQVAVPRLTYALF